MKIAIVTGASSGLGREYIKEINRKEKESVDEIWAIARREDRLRELEDISEIKLRPLPMDITEKKNIDQIRMLLEKEGPEITLLINAAGFAKIGNYESVSLTDSDRIIELNCRAAVDMT